VKKWVSGLLVALRLGRLVREARELTSSLVRLKEEVSRIVHKYSHLPGTANYDLLQLLRATDAVLENGADVLEIFGMKAWARRCRQWIDERLYTKLKPKD